MRTPMAAEPGTCKNNLRRVWMAISRSRADKRRDGDKAYEYRIAQYGPDEQQRAGRQAVWTRQNSERDKANNPHLRESVYSRADLERARRFATWHTANPARSHSENPHSWPSAQRPFSD